MRRIGLLVVLVSCAVIFAPSGALAGSYEYELQGTNTVARSGANVAHVEDPSALYLNVAGIGKLDQVQILLDTNITDLDTGVRLHGNRVDTWEVDGVEYAHMYVENKDSPFLGPFIAGSFGVPKVEGLVLGLGVFGPAAVGDYTFDVIKEVDGALSVPGPQRYDLVKERVLFFWPTIALAYRITPRLVVGMGFQWGYIDFSYKIVGSMSPVRTPATYQNSDFVSEVRAIDQFVPAYLFGIAYRPVDWLEIGLSLRVSEGIDAKSKKVVVTMNPWTDDPIRSDDESITWMDEDPFRRPWGRIRFGWPPIKLRTGVRFALPRTDLVSKDDESTTPAHLREWFDVEAAFFFETSGVIDRMYMQVNGQVPWGRETGQATVLRPDPEHPEKEGMFFIQRAWEDCWSVRLGGDVNLWKGRITLSAGGFYDRGAAPPAYSRLDYMAFDRWGLSGGFVFRVWKLDLKFSYVHMFYPEREVTDGQIRHLQGTGDPENAETVNSGTYKTAIDVFGLGVLLRI